MVVGKGDVVSSYYLLNSVGKWVVGGWWVVIVRVESCTVWFTFDRAGRSERHLAHQLLTP